MLKKIRRYIHYNMEEADKRYIMPTHLEKSKDEVFKFIENYADMQIKFESRIIT